MLPALQLCGTPTAEPTYTRRPHWTQPLESLWGILAKWQFINCLAYSTIARCVSSLSRTEIYQGVDLRVLECFDLHALAHYSGVPRAALAGGACSARADSPVLALTSSQLRFCPSCLNEGFHATLFQFTPIARCPIHDDRLLDACPTCRGQIPYRLDAAFAASPLACPNCSHPLLADPTVLMWPYLSAAKSDNILKWQRLLAKYAYWYAAMGPRVRRIDAGGIAAEAAGTTRRSSGTVDRLAFIGALQEVVHEPPSMPSIASRRTAMRRPPRRPGNAAFDLAWKPSFTNERWPHFQVTGFVDLCRRYARFHDLHRRRDSIGNRRVTHWWRRTWEGATSRPCSADDSFEDPPFGVAEWVAFSPPLDPHASAGAAQDSLILRFEEDLQLTWDSWSGVLNQVHRTSHTRLHPSLVPPRSCWLNEPVIEPGAPALGFF